MNSHCLLRLGTVVQLSSGMAFLALLLFTPAQFAIALNYSRSLVLQLFTNTMPNPTTLPLAPLAVGAHLTVVKYTTWRRGSAWS